MSDRAKLATGADGITYLMFWCEGCQTHHGPVVARLAGGSVWSWNGRVDLPTVQPSIRVQSSRLTEEGLRMIDAGLPAPEGGRYPSVDVLCHSYVTDGRIQYLGDCTHALAGQTVDLLPIEEARKVKSCDA